MDGLRCVCPLEDFKDALDAFFEVERAKVNTRNGMFFRQTLDHIYRKCNPIVFDELVVMLCKMSFRPWGDDRNVRLSDLGRLKYSEALLYHTV